MEENNPSSGRSALKAVFKVLGRVIGIALGIAAIIGTADYFGWSPLKNNDLGVPLYITISLTVWLAVELVLYSKKSIVVIDSSKTLPDVLIQELLRLKANGKYETIIRHRENLSRSLWIEGKLNHRVQLGKIAEEAAVRLENKLAQAEILIDDLGWSLVALKQYDEGKEFIEHGLQLAEKLNEKYLIAKSHRHLAGIYVEAHDYDTAEAELKKAITIANEMSDGRQKIEMIAGIEYGIAVAALYRKDPKTAINHLGKSKELSQSIGDRSRLAKVYSMKGTAAEELGNLPLAKDSYIMGHELANRVGRRDEMIRNLLGLARVFENEGDKETAEKYRQQAEEMKLSTPIALDVGDR
ncbi:MAG: hypothetical protein KAT58_10185, partial [candidate division Zixibacteria bacterium]|nr:hypothetical protein [candidate division Zixibacteria bacterium]